MMSGIVSAPFFSGIRGERAENTSSNNGDCDGPFEEVHGVSSLYKRETQRTIWSNQSTTKDLLMLCSLLAFNWTIKNK